jgi:hypothetical protein
VDLPVRSESRGTVTVGESGAPSLAYDFDGDSDVDRVLAPGDVFEPWMAYEVSFAGLRQAIRDAGMPRLLTAWFIGRVNAAEILVKKGGKKNVTAAKLLLESVAWSAELQEGKGLSEEDSDTIARLARELRQSL